MNWPEQTSIENSDSDDQLFFLNNEKESKNYMSEVNITPNNDILNNVVKKKRKENVKKT